MPILTNKLKSIFLPRHGSEYSLFNKALIMLSCSLPVLGAILPSDKPAGPAGVSRVQDNATGEINKPHSDGEIRADQPNFVAAMPRSATQITDESPVNFYPRQAAQQRTND